MHVPNMMSNIPQNDYSAVKHVCSYAIKGKREKMKGKSMKYVSIRLCAKSIEFKEASISIIDSQLDEYEIPYGEMVLVYIVLREGDDCRIPELADITDSMEGALVICNRRQNCFVIQTDETGKSAEEILWGLTGRAPHALFGSQPWLNEYDSRQFETVLEMVDMMRECT